MKIKKMKANYKIGITLFILGVIGVLSLLTVSINLDLPKEVQNTISPTTLKLLILVNPAILLVVAILFGTTLYQKVDFSVPTIANLLHIEKSEITFIEQVKYGIGLGIITGVLTTLMGIIFKSSIPKEFIEMGEKIKLTSFARFTYGGFTEEILMRFGFMTLVVWIVFKITKKLENQVYWIGIILATLLFAVGHLPAVYTAVQNPTFDLIIYIIIGNSIAGVFFGWLYWKKGLEAAFIAHIFAHMVMLLAERFLIS